MSAPAFYAFGTILTWAGFAFALRALFLTLTVINETRALPAPPTDIWQAGNARLATASAIIAAFCLMLGGGIASAPGLHIPLVWFAMPFSAWATIGSVVFVAVRIAQSAGALNKLEQRGKLKAAGLWFLGTIVWAFFCWLDPESKVTIIKGAIPLSGSYALALILLAVATVSIMVFTARAVRARNYAKAIATHAALIVGSILFGLPFAWLVITSFKEDIDMSSPSGIVWIPHVQETVPYFDKAKPLYKTEYQDGEVQGRIMERRPDGSVKLDVNKPMSMRGMTVETQFSLLTVIPIDAPLVTAKLDGQTITGKIVEELEDGHERVEITGPPSLAGRQQIFAPTEVVKIRKVGLRTQNYSDALDFLPPEAQRGMAYVKNTVIIVVLGMIGTILASALVAYAFSRMRFPGRDAMFTVMMATMMLPSAVTKLPQFMIFKQLGWIDTLYPLWVPTFFGSAFSIFMLRQFFKQVPMELEDAAKIDGAGYLRTFWSVMMPQIKPALAVIAILTFVSTWNNFLDPLIYINSPEKMTISYAVQLYASDRGSEPGLLTAFTTMSIIPVLALFFFAQRYFIEGVTLSGMGGR